MEKPFRGKWNFLHFQSCF